MLHPQTKDTAFTVNLDDVKFIITQREDGPKWTKDKADRVEMLYKMFLCIAASTKDIIVPTEDVDTFWHYHILHTKQYARDCNDIFGRYMHHVPIGHDNNINVAQSFAMTSGLYKELFGVDLASECAEYGLCGNCSNCRPDLEDYPLQ